MRAVAGGPSDASGALSGEPAIDREDARLLEQAREAADRLRQLDSMKNDLMSTAQHALRTPLTAILGLAYLAEMCWDTWGEQSKRDAVADIRVAARNLYDMVETVLDFSLLDPAAIALQTQPVQVRGALDRALASVSERYRHGIVNEVRIDVDDDLEVDADPVRFDQVLRAALDHAVAASAAGGVIEVTGRSAGSDRVLITVRDRGEGIVEDDLPHLFEPSRRAGVTATRRRGGAGLGLALVRTLAQAHGATAEVRSAPEEGTSLSLDWPAGRGSLEAVDPRGSSTAPEARASG